MRRSTAITLTDPAITHGKSTPTPTSTAEIGHLSNTAVRVNEVETRVIERKPWVFAADMRVITVDIRAFATSRSPEPLLSHPLLRPWRGLSGSLETSQSAPTLVDKRDETAPITHGRRADNPHNSSSTARESAQHVPSFGMSMPENDAKTRGIGRKPREIDAEVWVIAEGRVRVTPVPILRIARPCGQRHVDRAGYRRGYRRLRIRCSALNVGYHRVSAGDYRASEGLQAALQVQMTNAKNAKHNG